MWASWASAGLDMSGLAPGLRLLWCVLHALDLWLPSAWHPHGERQEHKGASLTFQAHWKLSAHITSASIPLVKARRLAKVTVNRWLNILVWQQELQGHIEKGVESEKGEDWNNVFISSCHPNKSNANPSGNPPTSQSVTSVTNWLESSSSGSSLAIGDWSSLPALRSDPKVFVWPRALEADRVICLFSAKGRREIMFFSRRGWGMKVMGRVWVGSPPTLHPLQPHLLAVLGKTLTRLILLSFLRRKQIQNS